MPYITLLGNSGHADVVAEVAEACGYTVEQRLGMADTPRQVRGALLPERLPERMHLAVGSNAIRARIAGACLSLAMGGERTEFPVLIHPSAIVSPSARIGEGTVVMAGAIIQANARIGRHCIINTGARIDHGCRLENLVHISPGAILCGDVTVGPRAWIGAGAVVIQGRTVGARATLGAGAVLISDLPEGATAVGVPAKTLPPPPPPTLLLTDMLTEE